MNEDFVSFELAKKLKEKGYPMTEIPTGGIDNRPSPVLYDLPKEHPNWQDCKAWWVPSISLVLKWLRSEKKIYVTMRLYADNGWYFIIQNHKGEPIYSQFRDTDVLYLSYEEASLAGITYVVDNLI